MVLHGRQLHAQSGPNVARRVPSSSTRTVTHHFPLNICFSTQFRCIILLQAEIDKPNVILIVSDDTGYGDLGPYGGGEGRGMPTPNIDRLASEGMTMFSFYAQPSCTPGRAAMQTGRIPNRSGMTTVAFQGQGGGLPAAEWTLASVPASSMVRGEVGSTVESCCAAGASDALHPPSTIAMTPSIGASFIATPRP